MLREQKGKTRGSVPGVEGKQDLGTLGWALWGLGEQTHAGRPRSHVRIILPPLSHFSNGHKFKETKHFFFSSPFSHKEQRGHLEKKKKSHLDFDFIHPWVKKC